MQLLLQPIGSGHREDAFGHEVGMPGGTPVRVRGWRWDAKFGGWNRELIYGGGQNRSSESKVHQQLWHTVACLERQVFKAAKKREKSLAAVPAAGRVNASMCQKVNMLMMYKARSRALQVFRGIICMSHMKGLMTCCNGNG